MLFGGGSNQTLAPLSCVLFNYLRIGNDYLCILDRGYSLYSLCRHLHPGVFTGLIYVTKFIHIETMLVITIHGVKACYLHLHFDVALSILQETPPVFYFINFISTQVELQYPSGFLYFAITQLVLVNRYIYGLWLVILL